MGPSDPNTAATQFRMVTVDFPRRITAVEARQSIWFQVGWLWWGDGKCWGIWKIQFEAWNIWRLWLYIEYIVYGSFVFILCFLKWSDNRLLCDFLVLMITTLWLCFSHDDDMVWLDMTCSSTMGHTGSSLDWSRSLRTADLDTRGCYMICNI